MTKWFLFAVAATFSGASLAHPQPASHARSASMMKIKQEKARIALTKFTAGMLQGSHIDPGYKGMPAAQLIDAIEKMARLKKTAFESEGDFEARKAASFSGRLPNDSALNDTFAFVVPVATGNSFQNGLKYTFNADTGAVEVFLLPKAALLNGLGAPDHLDSGRQSGELPVFDLDYRTAPEQAAHGSKPSGAAVALAREIKSTTYGLALQPITFLNGKKPVLFSSAVPAAQFNLDSVSAGTELPQLKALLITQVANPLIFYNQTHWKPVRDELASSNQDKYLHVTVSGIVLYSGLTGKIFARLPAASGM